MNDSIIIRFLLGLFFAGIAAIQGPLIVVTLGIVFACPLCLAIICIWSPFGNIEDVSANTWYVIGHGIWYILVAFSVVCFVNTLVCHISDRDNWLNAMALTQDEKTKP